MSNKARKTLAIASAANGNNAANGNSAANPPVPVNVVSPESKPAEPTAPVQPTTKPTHVPPAHWWPVVSPEPVPVSQPVQSPEPVTPPASTPEPVTTPAPVVSPEQTRAGAFTALLGSLTDNQRNTLALALCGIGPTEASVKLYGSKDNTSSVADCIKKLDARGINASLCVVASDGTLALNPSFAGIVPPPVKRGKHATTTTTDGASTSTSVVSTHRRWSAKLSALASLCSDWSHVLDGASGLFPEHSELLKSTGRKLVAANEAMMSAGEGLQAIPDSVDVTREPPVVVDVSCYIRPSALASVRWNGNVMVDVQRSLLVCRRINGETAVLSEAGGVKGIALCPVKSLTTRNPWSAQEATDVDPFALDGDSETDSTGDL
jgi:hypothetical protein